MPTVCLLPFIFFYPLTFHSNSEAFTQLLKAAHWLTYQFQHHQVKNNSELSLPPNIEQSLVLKNLKFMSRHEQGCYYKKKRAALNMFALNGRYFLRVKLIIVYAVVSLSWWSFCRLCPSVWNQQRHHSHLSWFFFLNKSVTMQPGLYSEGMLFLLTLLWLKKFHLKDMSFPRSIE